MLLQFVSALFYVALLTLKFVSSDDTMGKKRRRGFNHCEGYLSELRVPKMKLGTYMSLCHNN